jgi:hypothetical protein
MTDSAFSGNFLDSIAESDEIGQSSRLRPLLDGKLRRLFSGFFHCSVFGGFDKDFGRKKPNYSRPINLPFSMY